MAESVEFPSSIFKPDEILFTPNFRNTSGGVSLTGAAQIVGTASGLWEAHILASKIRTSRLVQLWEVLELRAEGRLNAFIIPVCGRRKLQAKAKTSEGQTNLLWTDLPHDDQAFFSDQTGYNQDGLPATSLSTVPAGRRSLDIAFAVAIEQMEAGIFFSINHRLYRIGDYEELGKNHYRLHFWPRLREGIKIGDDINFTNPSCKMRLKSDTSMAIAKNLYRFAQPDIELVEYF